MGFLLLFFATCLALTAMTTGERRVVCYYGSRSAFRRGDGKFAVEDIDPNLCTHGIYTFLGLEENKIKVLETYQDLSTDGGMNGFERFNDLRKQNPNLKTLVAIGGWREESIKYSKMVSDPVVRKSFIDDVVKFVKKHKFDGFDIDWEYPAQRGGSEDDVQNFVSLITEMRVLFDKEGLILSAAVAAAESSASQSYNIPELSKNLDFINLLAYDLHGPWEYKTGMNAALKPAASESGDQRQLNVEAIVDYWLSQGADPQKLNLGIATFGTSFTLANPIMNGVGAPSRGLGNPGPFTDEKGVLGYNEICLDKSWTFEFDSERRVPYAYKGDQWVGYDNVKSVKEKAKLIKTKKLGGAMVSDVENDDFRGKCGEKYPLIKTLQRVLNRYPSA